LWDRGNVVIVGRGSQKILAAKPNTLHVRFIGFLGARREVIMASEELTHAEALKKISAVDAQRAHYMKHYYDADWEDGQLYHLVINTSLMSRKQALVAITTAVRQLKINEGI
jgi:cytidylate kinase